MNKFLKDESGATAIEYAMIAGFMAIMLLVAFPYLSNALSAKFKLITSAVTASN
jgi:pilus assembly protein Flp/PilA